MWQPKFYLLYKLYEVGKMVLKKKKGKRTLLYGDEIYGINYNYQLPNTPCVGLKAGLFTLQI